MNVLLSIIEIDTYGIYDCNRQILWLPWNEDGGFDLRALRSELSVRARKTLIRKAPTIQLLQTEWDKRGEWRNCGAVTCHEIREWIKKYGIYLP